jgi:Glutaminase
MKLVFTETRSRSKRSSSVGGKTMPRANKQEMVTVAAVRRRAKATEYLFNEKQRIFTLRSGTKAARNASKLLNTAAGKHLPLKALLDSRRGLIRRVEALAEHDVREFKRQRVLLEEPERAVRVELAAIDPTEFNIVGRHLKCRAFRRCRRIVPNYKKAKKIFDYCAKQSCHLPGPKDISPCIPFQFVIDGCYARAHKMRKIITTKYRYCCEKVFSFANHNNDTLAVRADKWGGCCVTWWYHVAPLIRVRLGRMAVLALVIDPSMFDKPVLLSTWLAAQENKGCAANGKVSMYAIQPGSAYTPDNYQGTAFGTDPLYTSTDATLTNYANLTTC